MINCVCQNCRKEFPFVDARFDEHSMKWSMSPTYCYCPHCGTRLESRIRPDTVDFLRHLTPKYIGLFVLFSVIWVVASAFETMDYAGPAMVALFGFWLGVAAKTRDHRIIGWFLVAVATGIVYVVL